MSERRVVITGIGSITAIGSGSEGLWNGVRRGASAIRRITRFDPCQFRSQLAAEIDCFDPLDYMDARAARKLDRFSQFGLAAASQAIDDSGIILKRIEPSRVGVSVGSALGGVAYGEEQHRAFLAAGPRAVTPTLAVAIYGGAGGANIAIHFDLRGPNLSNASSCASGAVAIGEAYRAIQRNDADVMLAGGIETPLAPLTFGAFALIKAMSTRNDDPETACRPFDAERDGFVMAEGGAILVLEERGAAVERGASVYAELVGYGQTNDAYHMTAPRPDGSEAARAICMALQDAHIKPRQIGYVNAHATSTVLGDRAEVCALCRAFGTRSKTIPVSGTKGLYGHALGASGAIEIAITSLALRHRFLPGTTNLRRAESECQLNLVPAEGTVATAEAALSTSFGFGGVNAAVVLAGDASS